MTCRTCVLMTVCEAALDAGLDEIDQGLTCSEHEEAIPAEVKARDEALTRLGLVAVARLGILLSRRRNEEVSNVEISIEGLERDAAYEYLMNEKHDIDGKERRFRMYHLRDWLLDRKAVTKADSADFSREEFVQAILDHHFDGGAASEDPDDNPDPEPDPEPEKKTTKKKGRSRKSTKKKDEDKAPAKRRKSTKKKDAPKDKDDDNPDPVPDPTPTGDLGAVIERLDTLTDLVNTAGKKVDAIEKKVKKLDALAKLLDKDFVDDLFGEFHDIGENAAVISGLIQEYAKERGIWNDDEIKELVEEIVEDYNKEEPEGN